MFAASLTRRAASSALQVGRGAPTTSASAGSAIRTRLSTDITGVDVHPAPFTALKQTYSSTLSALSALPEESVYRNATTAVTKARMAMVEDIVAKGANQGSNADGNEEAIAAFEEQVDQGLIEEVLQQAKHELALAAKMVDWKP